MLYVYIGAATTPIVIETNLAWALPYWQGRKRLNPAIRFTHTPRPGGC